MASNKDSVKDNVKIQVYDRITGKREARKSRRNKLVPGVIYGPNIENMKVSIELLAVERFGNHRFEATIFELKSDETGLDKVKVLFKNVQKDPGSRRPIHVDFYALDMSKPVRVKVELKTTGESIGVKSEGGQLTIVLREIEVECRPDAIPNHIEVDISALSLGQSLHISDITFPDGVRPITLAERTVVTVSAPSDEPVATPAAAAPVAAAPAAGKAAAGKAPAAAGKAPAAKAPAAKPAGKK